MSKLLAMSFDVPASPSLSLKESASPQASGTAFGWGMGWYPPQDWAAIVIKDPTAVGDNAMTRVLRDWTHFESTLFLCHLRAAVQRIAQQDTQPFVKSYAGRDWILAHNGQLAPDFATSLPLGDPMWMEPVGRTDSEHSFCWLLTQFHNLGVRRIADVDPYALWAWLSQLNQLGPLNLVLSDGDTLVVYQDSRGYNALNWARWTPPHESNCLDSDDLELRIDSPHDTHRSGLLFSTTPLSGLEWTPLEAGQMILCRRGDVVWSQPEITFGVGAPGVAAETQPAVSVVSTGGQSPVGSESGSVQPAAAESAPLPRTYDIVHTTRYQYAAEVELSQHVLRLRPVHDTQQSLVDYQFSMTPQGAERELEDVFGNHVRRIEIDKPYRELAIESRSTVVVQPFRSLLPPSSTRRSAIPLVWMPWQRQMMQAYLLPTELPETQLRELFDFAMGFVERQDYDLLGTLQDMNSTIHRDFKYVPGSTTVETMPFEVYSTREGVCQDFANLLICLARLLGIPARYRVGYIHTGADYENKMQSDASHAWAEVYLPWLGWQGFDPTNGCLAGLDHIRVAAGRNYIDATPTGGTIFRGGKDEKLSIDVRVVPRDPVPGSGS